MARNDIMAGLTCNVICTVFLILVNKFLYTGLDFRCMVFLSFLHFLVTGTVCYALIDVFRVIPHKKCRLIDVLPVAFGSCGSVAFMNLNLAYNSVGFYQASKIMSLPVTIAIEYFLFGKKVSRRTLGSLGVILSGVTLATVTDLSLNKRGFVYGVVAVVCSALGQIFTASKQKQLGLNSLQLLYFTSPLICCGMGALSPLFDQDIDMLVVKLADAKVGAFIMLGCVLAVLVNISNYYVIGKTSPMTYQVASHAKTCLLLLLGFVVFNKTASIRQVCGIVIAMVGVVAYGENRKKTRKS